MWTAESCGRISICCSGFRSFRSRPRGWGENHFAPVPVAVYGGVLLGAAVAYTVLTFALIALHGRESVIAKAMGRDFKGKISIVLHVTAIFAACKFPFIACGL